MTVAPGCGSGRARVAYVGALARILLGGMP